MRRNIKSFFLWCAGSDADILIRCPKSEVTKQAGLGTLVLVPATLSLFAMSYALSTIINKPFYFVSIGLVWSLIIFTFDRYIVSSFRKKKEITDDIKSIAFISRLFLSIFIGIIVAHPLVLLVFNQTIDEKLRNIRLDKISSIEAYFDSKNKLKEDRIEFLKDEIIKKEALRNQRQKVLNDEIDGIVSGETSGVPGRRESAEEKARQLNIIESELTTLRYNNDHEISDIKNDIANIDIEKRKEISTFSQSIDYLAKANTLAILGRENSTVGFTSFFLIVFFIVVDILPVSFKVVTKRGPYDDFLDTEEMKASEISKAEQESYKILLDQYIIPTQQNDEILKEKARKQRAIFSMFSNFTSDLLKEISSFNNKCFEEHTRISRNSDPLLKKIHEEALQRLKDKHREILIENINNFSIKETDFEQV